MKAPLLKIIAACLFPLLVQSVLASPGVADIGVLQPIGTSLVDGVSSINFSNQAVGGSTSAKTFTITNTGLATITGLAIGKDGSNAGDFTVSALGNTSISYITPTVVGGITPRIVPATATFTVTFTPSGSGVRTAAIHITNSITTGPNTAKNPFDITLTGTGTAPEITVQQPAGTDLADGLVTNSFGNVFVGSNSVVKTFVVTNSGADNLILTNITKDGSNSGDFTISALGSTNLAAGTSTTFTVTFTPATNGVRRAALHLTNNDSDENPFDIALVGTGYTLIASNMTYAHAAGISLKIKLTDIAFDLANHPFGVQSLGASGAAATMFWDTTYLYYLPGHSFDDSFTYTITNTVGDVASNTLSITIAALGGLAKTLTVTNGSATIKFFGVPGLTYDVQRTTSLSEPVNWTTLTSSALAPGADGAFSYTDSSAPNGTAFYRSLMYVMQPG